MSSTGVRPAPRALIGLTAAEVAQRIATGHTNAVQQRTSRTVGEIVRANVFTVFNGLLGTLFVLTLATGRWQNALFGVVVVANSAIGIVQELRAKRTLDRLAVLNAPRARVVRDGEARELDVSEVVLDDLVEMRAGEQIVADGPVHSSMGLEVDESLLTGESDPVVKEVGDEVRSGSIVVAGSGHYRAVGIGAQAYSARLTAQARRFEMTRSELMVGTNRLLRWISVMMVVVAPLLIWSQFRSPDNRGWREAITGTVAALVGMVPEGLVLLTSLAFVVAIVTLVRKSTLVQELPAVEGLARVDVVCLDKTGTLTSGEIRFVRLEAAPGVDADEVAEALGLLARRAGDNPTAAALVATFRAGRWQVNRAVPFSSARKWSAVETAANGGWVLGAPEIVLHSCSTDLARTMRARADELAAGGQRVLALAHTPVAEDLAADRPLPDLVPAALVVLGESLRPDAARTLRYFTEQGVALKIISGDNPRTVASVAAELDVPGAAEAIDARSLPADPDELAALVEEHTVFGRVTPPQKRAMVRALQRRGHVVAMTGDGVNDALALKDADIGVAMGSGTPATRSVAQIVLLDSRFSHLPDVVAEGRRVIANIERVANLFLVKNVYSLLLAVVVAGTGVAYPFAPIQLTFISTVTIGVPAFVLALGPNLRRYEPGFLRRVLRFAVPTGVVTGAAAYAGYWTIRAVDANAHVHGARTTATLVVAMVSLWTLLVLARPLVGWKLLLIVTMAAVVVLVVAVAPVAHNVFLLDVTPLRLAVAAVYGATGAGLVEITHRLTRQRP